MPSLIRFVVFCAVVAGLVYGAMFALAEFVDPPQREMGYKLRSDQLPE